MARERRGIGVWALLLAVIVIGLASAAAWWMFPRQPTAAPQPALPEAVSKIPALLQSEIAALKDSNDRLAAGIAQAGDLLKGDVCDPKRQAELETLLQKVEFAAQIETAPGKINEAAKASPASVTPNEAPGALRNDALVKQLRAQTVFILAPLSGDDVMLGSGM